MTSVAKLQHKYGHFLESCIKRSYQKTIKDTLYESNYIFGRIHLPPKTRIDTFDLVESLGHEKIDFLDNDLKKIGFIPFHAHNYYDDCDSAFLQFNHYQATVYAGQENVYPMSPYPRLITKLLISLSKYMEHLEFGVVSYRKEHAEITYLRLIDSLDIDSGITPCERGYLEDLLHVEKLSDVHLNKLHELDSQEC